MASASSSTTMTTTTAATATAAAAAAMLHAQYRAQCKLGDALYGAVWLCEDLHRASLAPQSPTTATSTTNSKIATLVAVKQVSLRRARQTLLQNCCMDNPWDERRVAAKLMRLGGHANILRFHHEFVADGSWFMVTDYCDGGDLLSRLQQTTDSRFDESQALPLFAQIAQGVRFLHANGIAHRDLSLENVLLRGETPKLCDFGLSTETNRVCDERVGKAYYMAPEVVAERAYDPAAADMWSLGIMLFIMLTGSPLTPSAAADDQSFQAIEAFGVREILEKWGLDAEVSPGTIDVLEGLLQVVPVKRFTIEDLLAQLALQQQ